MAKTRASSRRPKSAIDRERYTAELSTMQLVIGVCILLMFGLGCFLLGVLIGKFDPSLQNQIAATEPQPEQLASPVNPPRTNPEPPPARPAENSLPPEMRAPQNLVEQQQRPEPEETTPPPSTTPPEQQEPAATTTSTPSADAPSAPESATPPAESPKPEPPKTTPEPKPSTVTASPPPATAPTGKYGVQIIAVARPRAEGVKRDIEARSDYKAEIISIDGDRLCKVVVGRFQDERTALAARTDLRTKYEFRDAYVITLN